jgi:hypothetical protein
MFTDKLRQFEEVCKQDTATYLASCPGDVRAAHEAFHPLLEHLYKFACCHWGCHGKEHVYEYLAGRTVSNLISAYGLTERGYYDEALSLVRSVGEIANLLNLFWVDQKNIRVWLDSNRTERRAKFDPYHVRIELKNLNHLIPFDEAHYKRLCELAVHPTPATRPNAYHDKDKPILGAYFQPEGFCAAFWEMSWALAVVAGPVSKLALFPKSQAEKMVELTVQLFELAAAHISE